MIDYSKNNSKDNISNSINSEYKYIDFLIKNNFFEDQSIIND
jgi:hypothetical protein